MAVAAVKHARNYTDDVEFSCEDAAVPVSTIFVVLLKPQSMRVQQL